MAHDEDAMDKEIADLVGAAQSAHDQDNPCTPGNHRVIVRLVVLVGRNLTDIRAQLAALPEQIAEAAMEIVSTQTKAAIDALRADLRDQQPALPGAWGMIGKWAGGWATAVYLIYTVSEHLAKVTQ
jgi:hypothetical protein